MIKFVNFALFYCYLTNNCIAFDELPALSRPVSWGSDSCKCSNDSSCGTVLQQLLWFLASFLIFADHRATDFTLSKIYETATLILSHLSKVILTTKRFVGAGSWEPKVAKIKHTRNENGQKFTSLFWRKKAKINLHQNFLIYSIQRKWLGENLSH